MRTTTLMPIAALTACLLCAAPCPATVIERLPGGERGNVAHLIAVGSDPLDIRVGAIRDPLMIQAILKGARTRRIHLLVDQVTPELRPLIGRKHLDVRLTTGRGRGRFDKDTLSYSTVLEIGKGFFEEWDGALVWTEKAFRPKTEFIAGGGDGDGEPWPAEAQTFDRDFAAASEIGRESRPHPAESTAAR